jgi:hypothetical protein
VLHVINDGSLCNCDQCANVTTVPMLAQHYNVRHTHKDRTTVTQSCTILEWYYFHHDGHSHNVYEHNRSIQNTV